MPYIANTQEDVQEMLSVIGCRDFDEMWTQAGLPPERPPLENFPRGRSEHEVYQYLQALADKNATDLVNFLGSGYYDHIIPAAVGEILGRSEFYTAYTPYQPEASQGSLQAIYEYQTAICRLTGMEVANASLYDGGTALFEAMMMAVRISKKRRAVLSRAVSPIFREMIRCYSRNLDVELVEVPQGDGSDSSQEALIQAVDDKTACAIVQYPNVFGAVEDWAKTVERIHAKKALAVCSAYPLALAILRPPGEMGFDIVTAEGQSLGIPLSFGGPYLGVMATTLKHMRKMPGRIVGRTVDGQGRTGFVLTLQAREQHIRREGAMSNICSNESLCAFAALAYLACVGKEGLRKVANLCAAKAVFAKELLTSIKGVEPVGDTPFFNEFAIRLPVDASDVVGKLVDKGYAAGFPLGRYYKNRKDQLLVAVTEKRTREEIKGLATALEAVLWN